MSVSSPTARPSRANPGTPRCRRRVDPGVALLARGAGILAGIAWVTEDSEHQLALVTGKPAGVLDDLVWDNTKSEPKWSPGAHGWVIPLDELPDLVCAFEQVRAVVRIRPLGTELLPHTKRRESSS